MLIDTCRERFGLTLNEVGQTQWQLPVRMGGCGVFKAEEVALAAFLGSVVQALGVISSLRSDADIKEIPVFQEHGNNCVRFYKPTTPPLQKNHGPA